MLEVWCVNFQKLYSKVGSKTDLDGSVFVLYTVYCLLFMVKKFYVLADYFITMKDFCELLHMNTMKACKLKLVTTKGFQK